MVICSNSFQHCLRYRYAWRSPQQTESHIDHDLIDGRHFSDIIDVLSWCQHRLHGDGQTVPKTFRHCRRYRDTGECRRILLSWWKIVSVVFQFYHTHNYTQTRTTWRPPTEIYENEHSSLISRKPNGKYVHYIESTPPLTRYVNDLQIILDN